jgi:DNA-binding beta-propeller fold protein YncE
MTVDDQVGRIFWGNVLGTVSMLDAGSGQLLRTVLVSRWPSALVADERTGHVFVAGGNGSTVTMLDASSGAVVRKIAVGAHPVAMALDERSDRLFVATWGPMGSTGMPTGPGTVSVLDGRSGSVLRSFSVGVRPRAIGVDEQSGHVFVANLGGTVRVSDSWSWVPGWLRHWLPLIPPSGWVYRTSPGSVTILDASR